MFKLWGEMYWIIIIIVIKCFLHEENIVENYITIFDDSQDTLTIETLTEKLKMMLAKNMLSHLYWLSSIFVLVIWY